MHKRGGDKDVAQDAEAAHDDGIVGRTVSDLVPAAGPDLDGPALEAAYRKSSLILISTFMFIAILCLLDANNLAFAALTMNRDLGFDAATYGLGASLYYLTVAVFRVPGSFITLHFGVRRWLGVMMVSWGVVASCFSLVHDKGSFFAMRLLLGLCEASVWPAMMFHVTQFFPAARLVKPYAIMACGILIAAIIGAPLATALLLMDGVRGLQGWQWLFLLEGLPPIPLGVAVFFFLPNTIDKAQWLTTHEKLLVTADMARQKVASPRRSEIPRNPLRLLGLVLRNPLLSYMCAAGVFIGASGYMLLAFTPIIINALLAGSLAKASVVAAAGRSPLLPIALSAVPFIVAVFATVGLAHSSQQRQEPFLHCGIAQLLSGVLLAVTPPLTAVSVGAGFAAFIATVSCYSAANGLTYTVASRLSAGPGQVVGVPVYLAIATAGGMLGPSLTGVLLQRTGGFTSSMLVFGVMLVCCGLIIGSLRWLEPIYERRLANLRSAPSRAGESQVALVPPPRPLPAAQAC